MTNARSNPNFNRKAKTENFKRSAHPDFKTSEEHRKAKFTGVRKNDLVMEWEFWILGEIKKRVSFTTVMHNKNALTEAHVELFAMRPEPGTFK